MQNYPASYVWMQPTNPYGAAPTWEGIQFLKHVGAWAEDTQGVDATHGAAASGAATQAGVRPFAAVLADALGAA